MGLLHELTEMAGSGTTGAGAVAMVPGSLFQGGMLHQKGRKKKHGITMSRLNSSLSMPRLAEALGITPDETKFNAADVISKLDAAEKKAKNTEDTVTFGMEDEDGHVVKVYVRADQAKDFEHALGALLGGSDENSDEQNTALEIAEVMFELKNKFDIIDVDWGEIAADEEEEQAVMGDEQNPEGQEGEMGQEGMDDMQDMPQDTGADASSALQQVIDLLKSQAEAQKAEAEAKTAEAKAKEAEYTAIAARSKVKQEEEVLDMESYYKKKQDEKKEAQRIAKLAKYKHDLASDAEDMLQGNPGMSDDDTMTGNAEEEEMVSPSRLAELIHGQIRGR